MRNPIVEVGSMNKFMNKNIIIYKVMLAFVFNNIRVNSLYNDLNTLRPRQNGRHFADDIFKCIFLNENEYSFEFN